MNDIYIYIIGVAIRRSIGFRILVGIPSSDPLHFGAPYAPFSKPQGSPFKRVNFFQRFTKVFGWFYPKILHLFPSKSGPNRHSIVLPQPAQLPQEFQSWTAVRPHRWCLGRLSVLEIFCLPKKSRCHPLACQAKNTMNLHYSSVVYLTALNSGGKKIHTKLAKVPAQTTAWREPKKEVFAALVPIPMAKNMAI